MFLTRKRIASEQMTGANMRIRMGVFGTGNPLADLQEVNPFDVASIYAYHEGDLFTPGAQNFVFEPQFELPLQTIWGFAFIRNPNTFSPLQHPQVWSPPNVQNNGIGGLEAGYLQFQPLLEPSPNLSEFGGS